MSNEELVAAIQSGESERMGELWEQVERLVKWKANRILTALEVRGGCGVVFDDLYQSGYLALAEAVETYEPAAGAFSAWFMYYLKTAFAEVTGYRTKTGKNEPLNNSLSLDKTVDNEADGTPFGELVPDPKAATAMQNIEEKLWQEQLHEALEIALVAIPERSAAVLRQRYYQDLSLAEIGEIQGVTAERIRQMENKAIRQLRDPSVACHLWPFYDFDFYCGTGLGAFQHSGMSIQERYLMVQEEAREREKRHRRERKRSFPKTRGQNKAWDTIERINQEAQEMVAQMTPEEKTRLLEKYGYL